MEDLKKFTVLVVEDDASTALAIKGALEHEGFTVIHAKHGKEGLAMALDRHPDITLADLKMPEMGGMEMIQEVRKDAWGKKARIVILTNVSDVTSVEEAMQHEAFFYIVKGDTSMAEIITKVREQLGVPKV